MIVTPRSFCCLLFLTAFLCLSVVIVTCESKRRKRVASSVVYSWNLGDNRVTVPEAKAIDLVSSFFHEINLTMVTAGKSHSAACDDLGTVYTWGANYVGQIGDGKILAHFSVGRTIPSPIYFRDENASSVVQLVSGHDHMLMLRSDGKLYAWGDNESGQLGDASKVNRNTPVLVVMNGALNGTVVTQIAAGALHSLLLTSDGRIFACGSNLFGQLGDGTKQEAMIPVAVDMSALNGKVVTQIAASTYHSVALASDGTVYFWGIISTHFGLMDSLVPTAVNLSSVMQGNFVTQISVGYFHTVMLTNDSKMYAFGSGEYGQLGHGEPLVKESLEPVEVDMSGQLSGKIVVQIAAGGYHTLALTSDGLLYGWGKNQHGQLDGTLKNHYYPSLLEKNIEFHDSITQIVAGGDHTMILTRSGKSYSWGKNEEGQLGNGKFEDTSNAVAIGMTGALSGKTITKILARVVRQENIVEHFVALTDDGKVYSWGTNVEGEVGDGTVIIKRFPVTVEVSGVLKDRAITQVTLGALFTVARADDGTMYSWGYNEQGQLGDGSFLSRLQPVAVFMDGPLSGQTNTKIVAGRWHVVSIADGRMYSWGYNTGGLLGDETTQNRKVPVSVVMKGRLKDRKVVQVAAGSRHTVALTDDGTLYTWGYDICGMLKIDEYDYRSFPYEVEKNDILKDIHITHMTAGASHTTVLASNNQIYSWGLSDFGVTIPSENRPVRLSMNGLLNGKEVSEFVVNDSFMMTLTKDGQLGYWDFRGNYSTWVRTSNVDSEYSITSLFIGANTMGFLGVVCERGYYGQDCELFGCYGVESKDERRICSGNGICVDLDTCKCNDGYTGINCSYPICNGHSSTDTTVCSSHGMCQRPNKCICNHGYHGETCASNLIPLYIFLILGTFLFISLIIIIIVVGLQIRRARREAHMKSELKACLLEEMGEYGDDDNIERGDFYIDMKKIKLVSRISEGAFGVVFKGEWKSNLVAVKKMKVADDESFIKEVSILQSLRHPNILYLFGYSSNDSGDKFLITEYAVNGSLDKLLHKDNPSLKAFDQKMNVLCQIADTMTYLHERSPRIVHRDLKPQNILLGDNYHVRICDFGLSKITDSAFTQGRSYGTIEYCAPELLAHREHDEKVDIYSFGIIMHEMFIMAPPYSQHAYSSIFTLGLDIVKGLRPPLRFDPFNTASHDSQVPTDFFLQSNTTNMPLSDIPVIVQGFYSLVTRCWDADTTKRPSFEELTTELDSIKKRCV